jgi:hypothetical protein
MHGLQKLIKLEDCIWDGPAFPESIGYFYPTNSDAVIYP